MTETPPDQFAPPAPLPPPTGAPAPVAASQGKQRYARPPVLWVAFAGIIAMVIGSIGPWAKVSLGDISETINGTTNGKDGTFVIVGAGIALFFLILFSTSGRRGFLTATVVFAILSGLIPVIDISDLNHLASTSTGADISTAWGIWVALVGCVMLAIGSLVSRVNAPPR